MNKIIIEKDKIQKKLIDDSIVVEYFQTNSILPVAILEINIMNNTDLEIDYNVSCELKLNVSINILDNVNINIYENYINGKFKVKNSYNISKFCNVNIQKFYHINEMKQFDSINLNGDSSNANYILKTINTQNNKYNLVVNHNAFNTKSEIINNAVNLENGKIFFDVTGFVPKGIKKCSLNQINRIVNFNQNKCQINPILLIDENDVEANHSAFIGKFSDEEIFYLQSRGINYDGVIKLLVKGFLFSNLKHNDGMKLYIDNCIKKYWG